METHVGDITHVIQLEVLPVYKSRPGTPGGGMLSGGQTCPELVIKLISHHSLYYG